jgi:hypothetical protein
MRTSSFLDTIFEIPIASVGQIRDDVWRNREAIVPKLVAQPSECPGQEHDYEIAQVGSRGVLLL